MFQFTHPGGVRLQAVAFLFCRQYVVSIHAPGRGATAYKSILRGEVEFQFTHPGGVRPKAKSRGSPFRCFNSRTREGCDQNDFTREMWSKQFQFTHPGGVRHTSLLTTSLAVLKFQFTHPGGVRRSAVPRVSEWGKFQFTHPGGVRHNHQRRVLF
ncbi:hypothetical protein HMPREF3185_02149 [Porphyromonas somerae]|uniref:Uncharacterized protein n=1 Tax=Porphyromonas somerae TaxID=322095 RepID=A0A134AZB5_9PORP|nr:hypothetical protein HMPREF3184_02149 [Porphyromonadaceae bacterium KA00676]KXB73022.1 hypothetical protein HMPREF3185_02149 [Porphyromonas somerae]